MLERLLKMRRGIIGYFANFHSLTKNRPIVKRPKTIRQITFAEDQGALTPPYSRPKRNISVPPMIRRAPDQSIAFRPARRGVLGVSMSRNTERIMNARPSQGLGSC